MPSAIDVIQAALDRSAYTPTRRPSHHTPASERLARTDGPANQTPGEIWFELCMRAGQPVVDHAAELAYIESRGRKTRCGECRKHWQALLAVYPPDTSRPESYTAWVWFVRNMIGTSIGKPWVPYSRVAPVYGWPE